VIEMAKRKTQEEFEQEVFSSVGDEYKVIGNYIGTHNKIKMIHVNCGHIFDACPHNFLSRGSRCPYCFGTIKLSNKDFLYKLHDAQGKNVTPLENIKNTSTSIRCKCNKCGTIWNAMPLNLLKGSVCPTCAIDIIKSKTRKSNGSFINELHNVHGSNIKPIDKYINSTTKIRFKCSKCSTIWTSTPKHILMGRGCPHCKISKGERAISNFLVKKNITFESQKSFIDLHGINNGLLSYDFYLPDYNTLIEYQGNFHDGTSKLSTDKGFEIQKRHDELKKNYARNNKIDLIEIWYWDYENINSILSHKLNISLSEAS